ncbi:MAG TPA: carboxymuconolactone decarboxylase family protein [Bryobacteraceae bacterium]|nr:carboxymuconolactone decarboxylase family protein [Bryobacteraceae bacterium]
MYSMDKLSRLPKLDKLAPDSTAAFWAYDKALPLLHCIELHRKAALKAGVTGQELGEAIHVAAALRAGAAITHCSHLLES